MKNKFIVITLILLGALITLSTVSNLNANVNKSNIGMLFSVEEDNNNIVITEDTHIILNEDGSWKSGEQAGTFDDQSEILINDNSADILIETVGTVKVKKVSISPEHVVENTVSIKITGTGVLTITEDISSDVIIKEGNGLILDTKVMSNKLYVNGGILQSTAISNDRAINVRDYIEINKGTTVNATSHNGEAIYTLGSILIDGADVNVVGNGIGINASNEDMTGLIITYITIKNNANVNVVAPTGIYLNSSMYYSRNVHVIFNLLSNSTLVINSQSEGMRIFGEFNIENSSVKIKSDSQAITTLKLIIKKSLVEMEVKVIGIYMESSNLEDASLRLLGSILDIKITAENGYGIHTSSYGKGKFDFTINGGEVNIELSKNGAGIAMSTHGPNDRVINMIEGTLTIKGGAYGISVDTSQSSSFTFNVYSGNVVMEGTEQGIRVSISSYAKAAINFYGGNTNITVNTDSQYLDSSGAVSLMASHFSESHFNVYGGKVYLNGLGDKNFGLYQYSGSAYLDSFTRVEENGYLEINSRDKGLHVMDYEYLSNNSGISVGGNGILKINAEESHAMFIEGNIKVTEKGQIFAKTNADLAYSIMSKKGIIVDSGVINATAKQYTNDDSSGEMLHYSAIYSDKNYKNMAINGGRISEFYTTPVNISETASTIYGIDIENIKNFSNYNWYLDGAETIQIEDNKVKANASGSGELMAMRNRNIDGETIILDAKSTHTVRFINTTSTATESAIKVVYVDELGNTIKVDTLVGTLGEMITINALNLERYVLSDELSKTATFSSEIQQVIFTYKTIYEIALNDGENTTEINVTAEGKIEGIIDPVKKGHRFVGWFDEENNKIWDFENDTVTSNTSLVAVWQINDYQVNFIDGTNNVSSVTVTFDELVNGPRNMEKEGYVFAGWYKDQDFKNKFNFDTEKIEDNLNLYARWVLDGAPQEVVKNNSRVMELLIVLGIVATISIGTVGTVLIVKKKKH